MDKDLKEIVGLLNKAFPNLLNNPEIMIGCDISDDEIEVIKRTKKLTLGILEHVAGDGFFGTYYDEVGLSEDEGIKVDKFLTKTASYFVDELKDEVSCLEVENEKEKSL